MLKLAAHWPRKMRYAMGLGAGTLLILNFFYFPLSIALTHFSLTACALVGAYCICSLRERRNLEKKLTSELVDSNAHLAAVLKSIQHGILLVDQHGKILMANQRVQQYFGYEDRELLGMLVEDLLPQDIRERHRHYRADFDQAPKARMMSERGSLLAQRKNGTIFPVDVGLSPLDTERGHFIVTSVADMSSWAKLQEELKEKVIQQEKLNQELVGVNGRLNDFVYVASHDLKAPLRAIDNLASWIAEDCASTLPPASQKHFEQLRGRVRRMESLLDTLLEYSRVGCLEEADCEVDVHKVLTGIIEILDVPANFTVSISPSMPVFFGALVPFEQVFRNLIDNAIKHHDSASGRIDVCCAEQGNVLRFEISDDGPGIPVKYHDRVFKLFQTLKPRDEKEGSGMGLAVVRRIVTMHGGKVYLKPSADRGATFVVEWKKGVSKVRDQVSCPPTKEELLDSECCQQI